MMDLLQEIAFKSKAQQSQTFKTHRSKWTQ